MGVEGVRPITSMIHHLCFISFFLDFFLSDPWTMGFSKKTNRKFFYNKKTRLSTFDLPVDSIAPFQ